MNHNYQLPNPSLKGVETAGYDTAYGGAGSQTHAFVQKARRGVKYNPRNVLQ